MKDFGYGKASGKIIIMGEHAVVHGLAAVVFPFSAGLIEVKAMLAKTQTLDDQEGLKSLVKYCLKQMNLNESLNIELEIKSNIPMQRGLGSSASVSVATVRALFDLFEKPLDDALLFECAMVAERIHHENPSGLDVMTIVQEKPILFIKDKGVRALDIHQDIHFVVVDTQELGETKKAVKQFGELLKANPTMKSYLDTIHSLSESVVDYLETSDVKALGEAMTQNHEILKRFKVSSDTLDMYVQHALTHGALGAKLTGGGLGGCMIALVDSEAKAKELMASYETLGNVAAWHYVMERTHHDTNR